MQKQIAWTTGTGNLTLAYTGHGNGSIVVTSDDNNLYEARSMQVVVKTTDGSNISQTLTVTQAAKVKTDISNAIVTASNQTYNGSAKTPTPTVTLNGQTIPSSGYDVAYSNNVNAGTATITVTGKGDYTGTATGTFTINKATGSVTTVPTARNTTYNGSSQYLVTAGSGTGTIYYRYCYKSYSSSSYGSWSSWSTSRPSQTNAGYYQVEYYAAESTNYTQSSTGTVSSIERYKASISPTVSMADWTYGGTASNPSVSGNSGGGSVTYAYKVRNASSYSSTKPSQPGFYTVRATIGETTNYNGATCTTNFAIHGTVTISPSVTSGHYVRSVYNVVQTLSFGYISSPVQLMAGAKVSLTAYANDHVAMISLTNSYGSSYTSVADGTGDNQSMYSQTATYTATADCYIAFSYLSSYSSMTITY